jgi:hypothetical protein
VEAFEQSRRALPKNLIRPLPVQDCLGRGSGDLLSRSPVHTDEWDEVAYAAAQQASRGVLCVFYYVLFLADTRAYL